MDIYITYTIFRGIDGRADATMPSVVAAFSSLDNARREATTDLPEGQVVTEWENFATDMRGVEFWRARYDAYSGPAEIFIHRYPLDKFSSDLGDL